MSRLCIFGAGGHGKVAASIAELVGYKEILFYDDNFPNPDKLPWSYRGTYSDFLAAARDSDVFIAVGNCQVRDKIMTDVKSLNSRLINLIHPSSVISPYAKLGVGLIVVAGAVINPFCEVGDGVIINTGATVGHDCTIHSCAHIAPGVSIAGHCVVKSKAWVGINSSLIQGVVIGENAFIGAGSVVIRNVGDNLRAFGNPASIKSHNDTI